MRTLDVWHLLVGLTRGGAEQLLVNVLPGMLDHGVRPRVLALKGWGPVGDDLNQAGVPVEALGGLGRGDPRPVLRLLTRLRQERPVLVHAHLLRAVLAGSWACRWAGIPLAVHFHSLCGRRPGWQDRLERSASRQACHRVAVSQAVADDRATRLRLPAAAFTVIPNGVPVSRFATLPELTCDAGRDPVVGFLGRLLLRTKGLDTLLEAMERLQRRGSRLHLQVAGGPESARQQLEDRSRELGLNARVLFLGEVADSRKAIENWDFLVLPSREEGFGLSLVEGMAAGRPVVASRTGGIPEVVDEGRTGILFSPGDAGGLATALQRLTDDLPARQEMGRRARETARRRFDAAGTAAAWARLARDPSPREVRT